MYQAGDYVMYAGNGLCLVEGVGVPDFQPPGNNTSYYFLRTMDEKCRISIPVDTSLPIRRPMTKQEAEALLAELSTMKTDIPAKFDYKLMVKRCKDMLRPHTALAMAQTIQLLHAAHPTGKMSSEEGTILKRTETIFSEELAYSLHISAQEASEKLHGALKRRRNGDEL